MHTQKIHDNTGKGTPFRQMKNMAFIRAMQKAISQTSHSELIITLHILLQLDNNAKRDTARQITSMASTPVFH